MKILNLPGRKQRRREQHQRPKQRWQYGLALLILAGYLLFAHGCHIDQDTELLARLFQP